MAPKSLKDPFFYSVALLLLVSGSLKQGGDSEDGSVSLRWNS
jgi:hypothetical protein